MELTASCSSNNLINHLLDPSWLRNHAIRFARTGRAGGKTVDEIMSDATDFILTGYNLSSFDPKKHPGVDPVLLLKGHCASSLLRHLSRCAKIAARKSERMRVVSLDAESGTGASSLGSRLTTDDVLTKKVGTRGTVLLSLLRMDGDPKSMQLCRIIDGVKMGNSFAAASRLAGCKTIKTALCLVDWARRRYEAIGAK